MAQNLRRKDTASLRGVRVDFDGTTALYRGKGTSARVRRMVKQVRSIGGLSWDSYTKGMHASVLTGAVRTGDSLKPSGLWTSDLCPYCRKGVREDRLHFYWQCSPLGGDSEALPCWNGGPPCRQCCVDVLRHPARGGLCKAAAV